jgi:hypothetical protein
MDDETKEDIMLEWQGKFWAKLRDHNIRPECLYNADQTGLFFNNKMLNRMYIEREHHKEFKGVKAMKSKDRITLMVFTSCNGKKVPLAVVGKANQPTCFHLSTNGVTPLPYKQGQKNVWFNKEIMMWWILHVPQRILYIAVGVRQISFLQLGWPISIMRLGAHLSQRGKKE